MDDLAETGVSIVTVKTLDSSAGYAPYEATRAFYERTGYALEATLVDFYAPGDGKCIYVKRV